MRKLKTINVIQLAKERHQSKVLGVLGLGNGQRWLIRILTSCPLIGPGELLRCSEESTECWKVEKRTI